MARGSHHSSGGHYRSSSSGMLTTSSTEPPEGVKSYNGNWMSGSMFHLNMEDPVVQERARNKKIYNEGKLFGILGVGWLICMFFFSTNAFYEMVIPVFENMSMNDLTFAIFDDMIYYSPSFIMIALFIVIFILCRMNKENKRALCKEVIDYYSHMEYERKVELETQEKINHSELYSECPNCGAPVPFGSLNCEYCGSNLVKE